jgi:hypothetical protein
LDFYKPISYYNNEYNDDFYNTIKDFSFKYQEKFKINKDELLETSFDSGNILKFKSLYKEYNKEPFIAGVYSKFETIKWFQQYFYVYTGYELLETHIKNHNIHYDSIIKLRFDQLIWNDNFPQFIWNDKFYRDSDNDIIVSTINKELLTKTKEQLISALKNTPLKLDIPESNDIYVFGCGVFKNYTYLNDQFWCHNMDKISIIKIFYIELSYIIELSIKNFWPCHGARIEYFFAQYIFRNKFSIKKSKLKGVFCRVKDNGNTDDAVNFWRAAIATDTQDAKDHFNLGIVQRGGGMLVKVVQLKPALIFFSQEALIKHLKYVGFEEITFYNPNEITDMEFFWEISVL